MAIAADSNYYCKIENENQLLMSWSIKLNETVHSDGTNGFKMHFAPFS